MRHLSLFTGSGIGDYAAEQCGIEAVAQCECDPACLYCLERLFPNAKQFKDVRDVSIESLRKLLPIDIISGGAPCQDISTAGKGKGITGERSGLWFEMLRIIDEVRPAWVLAENVPALRVRGADAVLSGMEELGYTCWPVVVGAWAVGAPHKRDRVWIVAHRSGIGRPSEGQHDGRFVSGGDSAMDHANRSRLGSIANAATQSGRHSDNGTGSPRFGSRWPSRPGEPQHDWEAPRLVEFGVGDAVDGVARRLRSRANKALLRMAGNGWCYPIPKMIYQWIMEVEHDNARR